MAKKAKNKVRRQEKAKVIQESLMSNIRASEGNQAGGPEDIVAEVVGKKNKYVEPAKDNFLHETKTVKREIKKIALVFGVILLVLIGLKVADGKTGIVIDLADKVSQVF